MIAKNTFKKYYDRAIENILYEGITDVELFNRPFELSFLKNEILLKESRTLVYNSITAAIKESKFENLKIHKLGYVLVPANCKIN